jgi:hypothetical protein
LPSARPDILTNTPFWVTLFWDRTRFTTSSLSIGAHIVTANYINADDDFSPSTATLSGGQTVTTADATVTVGSSAPTSGFGQSVTFMVTVAPVTTGLPTPTGNVELFDGTTELRTATLDDGSVTYTTATLAVGMHSITAQYEGDQNFSAATSPAIMQVVVTSSGLGTTTMLNSSVNPSVFGQTVTFTATVGPVVQGSGTPTGTVEFLDGTTELGTEMLSDGTASFSSAGLDVGSHSITAAYVGDSSFAGSTSSATSLNVQQASTTTSVSANTSSSVFGQSVTFTATIAVVTPGAGTPTGTVTFLDGLTELGTGTGFTHHFSRGFQ